MTDESQKNEACASSFCSIPRSADKREGLSVSRKERDLPEDFVSLRKVSRPQKMCGSANGPCTGHLFANRLVRRTGEGKETGAVAGSE